jgi:NhaP-type Na+/H+ or K+/H+ antiporter
VGLIVVLFLLMVYNLFEAYKHKHHLNFGHEAALVALLGLFLSWLFFESQENSFNTIMAFNGTMFFYFVLPPIVFAAGFNMYRKEFFKNITNVLIFGIGGTFVAFGAYFSIVYFMTLDHHLSDELHHELNICQEGVNDAEDCTNFCPDGSVPTWDELEPRKSPCIVWGTIPLTLNISEIAIMCACLVSSDVIAAVSLIDKKKKPKLFSVVFGEGIVNDAVSIILFNAVLNFAKSGEPFNSKAAGMISLEFCYLFFMSLIIGLFFGLLGSLLFKHIRSLTQSAIVECSYIFLIAYCSYITAELLEYSGIITLLISGITMAQYAWYSLSVQGRLTSVTTFDFMAFIAEGFVFAYLGLTFYSYREQPWSWGLIGIVLLAILFGRGCGVFLLMGVLKMFGYEKKDEERLKWSELLFIWYAGLIRGAIAFGLVLRIDDDD